jgi:hypothetical protein
MVLYPSRHWGDGWGKFKAAALNQMRSGSSGSIARAYPLSPAVVTT